MCRHYELHGPQGLILQRLATAESLPSRMRGLLGRDGLPEGDGLLIRPCPSIHTFFMRFTIDAIFVDVANTVVRVVRDITPFRAVSGGWKAHGCIEVQSGWLSGDAVREGDALELR